MTSVPRDPAFWRRFSTAVHLSEGKPVGGGTPSPFPGQRPVSSYEPEESWLDQQARKKRRNRVIVCVSALLIVAGIALIVLILVYLHHHDWYLHGEPFTVP